MWKNIFYSELIEFVLPKKGQATYYMHPVHSEQNWIFKNKNGLICCPVDTREANKGRCYLEDILKFPDSQPPFLLSNFRKKLANITSIEKEI